MSTLLLLTGSLQPSADVLPGLALLGHQVKILPAEGSALLEAPDADLLLVDGQLGGDGQARHGLQDSGAWYRGPCPMPWRP